MDPSPTRILVVDDNEAFRVLLRQTLRKAGYEVAEACDGDEALRLFTANPVRLVITDVLMPEKDGIETIRALRRGGPPVKILAISGGGRLEPRMCLSLAKMIGADRVLAKPFEPEPLLAIVRELVAELK
jgi:CheY-like chemotaxis protein